MNSDKDMMNLYLSEMGFDKNCIKEALKMTNDLDEATNILVEMKEEYENEYKDYKMVIIVREDLNMSIGKTAAQVGHVVLDVYNKSLSLNNKYLKEWERIGVKKIVLKVPNEELLLLKYNLAKTKNIPTSYIRDAGLTEVAPMTITVCAFGPWLSTELDTITGDLKLLK